MDNPYDPVAREELGVDFHWDHVFYNNKYYVYFGVAPVILTFIPYKILTGESLTTYHATQIYTALFIVGMFLLLYNIYKYFCKDNKLKLYLLLASVLSIISVWICVSRPALYCTAIAAGLCMAIWSLYFYTKAVYGENDLNKSILYATLGALFGALTFACRPPIALINIVAIPLVIIFFKKYGFNKKVVSKVLIAIIPYIVIGALLMIYNHARFGSVFEFGQSYQLTEADQHNYLNIFSRISLPAIKYGLEYNFFLIKPFTNVFPYVSISGMFINFPILLIPYLLFLCKEFRKSLKDKKVLVVYIVLMVLPFAVSVFNSIGSPFPVERYFTDIYYILAILCFISIVNYFSIQKNEKKSNIFKYIIYVLTIITLITCVLLFFVPRDKNFTEYYPDINTNINNFITNIIK